MICVAFWGPCLPLLGAAIGKDTGGAPARTVNGSLPELGPGSLSKSRARRVRVVPMALIAMRLGRGT